MHPLRRLYPYVKPHAGLIVASGLLAIPLALLRFSPAPLLKYLVDDLATHHSRGRLLGLTMALIAIYVANFFVRFGHFYLIRVVYVRVGARIRQDLFNHFSRLSADYFTQRTSGQWVARVTTDPMAIDTGIASINSAIREPLTFLILLGYVIHLNWRLGLLTLVIFPLLALIFHVSHRAQKRTLTKVMQQQGEITSSLHESFSGIRILKLFQLERWASRTLVAKLKKFAKESLKVAAIEEASHPSVELIGALALAPIIYFGGSDVLDGQMTTGELVAFFTSIMLMMDPIRKLNDVNLKFSQATAAAQRISEALDWQPTVRQPKHPVRLDGPFQSLALRGVSFWYPEHPERRVLDSVSFTLEKGRRIAVVGPSGGGKSTLVQLLPRIFDPNEGTICVNGVDIRSLSFKELRRLFAFVSQDVFLFNDTVEANVRAGMNHLPLETVIQATKDAFAHEFIERMPDGLQTMIGERGQKLSGGEKQRISIARAFLRNSPILILDEATSNLDTQSEVMVQQALSRLQESRTSLVIAHRLSTIQSADEILVIQDGRVIQRGNHASLAQTQGLYAELLHGK